MSSYFQATAPPPPPPPPPRPNPLKVEFVVLCSVSAKNNCLTFSKTALNYSSGLFKPRDIIFCPFLPFKVYYMTLKVQIYTYCFIFLQLLHLELLCVIGNQGL